MRIRNTRCLGVFLLGLTPTLALGQVAPESRDRPHDVQGWPTQAVRASHGMVTIGKEGKLDEEASVIGYQSVAVPGTVAGLALALKIYGSMKLADVMAPAIRLAENGFPISKRLAQEFEEHRPALQRFAVSRRIFLNDGKMFQAGDTFRQ